MIPEICWESYTLVLSGVVALLIVVFALSRRSNNFPPGPKGLPLIGSIPLLAKGRSSEIFMNLRKEYGDVFSIRLGQYFFVVLNGYDTIREALIKHGDSFKNRANLYIAGRITLKTEMFLGNIFNCFAVIDALLIVVFALSRKKKNFKPGPRSSPLIGSIPLPVKGRNSEIFIDLRKDVVSIRHGQYLLVVFYGYDTTQEAMIKYGDSFKHRVKLYLTDRITLGTGITRTSGESWRQTRQFAHQALRGFGLGKHSIESKIMDEVDVFMNTLRHKQGEPFDTKTSLHTSVVNIISSIVFGKRFELDDKRFHHLLALMDEGFRLIGSTNIGFLLPVLRFLPGDMFKIKEAILIFDKLTDFLREIIKEHESSYNEDNTRDYVDAFIKERNIRQRQGKQDPTFADDNLAVTVMEFFTAGSETTATTILWFLLHLIHHKDVQDKLYKEVLERIGDSRKPRLADQPHMPYFNAVLTEVFRMKTIVPLALQYGALEDIQFKGYTIPKGAVILINLESSGMNPNDFVEAEKFDPSRFLDNDGQLTGDHHKAIPFSIGRRACLGESLARNELFLYLTSLVQRFEILAENEAELPSLEGVEGITYAPQPFKFKAVERK